MVKHPDPVDFCETFLRHEQENNTARGIWPSVNRIIDRVLARQCEMAPVYEELLRKLDEEKVQRLLESIVGIPAVWSEDYISDARAAARRQNAIRERIGVLARELSQLFREREELSNHSGMSARGIDDVVDVLRQASIDNGLFVSFLEDPLQRLQYQFDDKYWPTLGDFIEAIADNANTYEIEPTDEITRAATSSTKTSLADSVRALMSAIESKKLGGLYGLPTHFRLTDESVATIINVTLNRDSDSLIGSDYVKRLRQRDRGSRRNEDSIK